MADRTLDDFTLSDAESLALTLAKLALMEVDLENSKSHTNRIVKREVVRRYCSLFEQILQVPAPTDDAHELPWPKARDLADELPAARGRSLSGDLHSSLKALGHDARRYLVTSPQLAAASLDGVDQRRRAIVLMIELAAFQPWPESTDWNAGKRREALFAFVDAMPAPVDHELMREIDKELAVAVRRLSRREVDMRKVVAVVAGGAAVGVLTGGLAAPLIGGAVGGAMGLSGAAATSAGLALLGGGSVAAGGLGMAGGTAILAGAAGVGAAGAGAAGTWLAGAPPTDVVVESAKLEVLFEYLLVREERSDDLQRLVVARLQEQISDLVNEINDLTGLVVDLKGVSHERDELQVRLDEETEKRRVLEKTLESFQHRLRQGEADRAIGT
ncbi:MAG: hypothetical protein WD942_06145 [Dehalococcoidia bacterium]